MFVRETPIRDLSNNRHCLFMRERESLPSHMCPLGPSYELMHIPINKISPSTFCRIGSGRALFFLSLLLSLNFLSGCCFCCPSIPCCSKVASFDNVSSQISDPSHNTLGKFAFCTPTAIFSPNFTQPMGSNKS